MGGSWLPTWLAGLLTAVLAVVLVVHVLHATAMSGRSRLWHCGHILMALGMIDMYWPGSSLPVGVTAGETVFGLAAAGFVVIATLPVVRGPGMPWMWLIAALDMAAMTYMYAMMSHRVLALALVLAAWFLAEAALWTIGALAAVAQHEDLVLEAGEPVLSGGNGCTKDPAVGDRDRAGSVVATRTRLVPSLAAHHRTVHARSVRITLAVMSLGMGYMLLAMQFGMAAVAVTHGGTPPGMPGMPGM